MVSVYLNIHQATRALFVPGASGIPHLPENMVKSEVSQADEGYFTFSVFLNTYICTAIITCKWMTD